jgi:acyl-coenzyme A synthetase/AMP-(fatty) acid ligase
MPNFALPAFSMGNLIAGTIFSSIGFIGFIYGKRMSLLKPLLIGIALMAYPYFVENTIAMCAIGAVGTAALFLFRD